MPERLYPDIAARVAEKERRERDENPPYFIKDRRLIPEPDTTPVRRTDDDRI